MKRSKQGIIAAAAVCAIAAILTLLTLFIFTTPNGEDEYTILPFEETLPFINNGVVMFVNEKSIYVRGELLETSNPPFIKDGMTYVPVNDIAIQLGFDFDINPVTRIVSLAFRDMTSQFLVDFNLVVLNGSQPIMMRSNVIEQNGIIYMSASVLAKIINISCFQDYDQGIVAIFASKPLTKDVFATLQNYAGIERKSIQNNRELDDLMQKHKISDIYQLSREERLYVTDKQGVLYRWVLLDDFLLIKETFEIDTLYDSDTVYIAGLNVDRHYLFTADDYINSDRPERVSFIPDIQVRDNLRNTMMRFLDAKIKEDMGDLAFTHTIDYYGDTTKTNQQQTWANLCAGARSGDILLFRSFSSDEKYGFMNHAALILNVSTENNEIHVLHARSNELGVGADLPMDRINFETLYSEDYWSYNDIIILCRVDGMSDETGRNVAEKAYEKYKTYEFGFGSFLGLRETTCVEIIRDSLRLEGVEIISDREYITMLKSALDHNDRSIVLIPDDVIMSEHILIVYFWQR